MKRPYDYFYAVWPVASIVLALAVILAALAWVIFAAAGCHPPCGPVREHPKSQPEGQHAE